MTESENESGSLFPRENPRVYSVSGLTEQIKDLLEGHFEFIWIEGEISNFRAPASGHYYMVLKDEKAQIRAVMFRPQSRYLKFTPEDGMMVVARGRIGVYQPRGEYQIILDYLEPLGVGALALAFEQLKKKLAAEGVFDAAVKRPLPFLPQKVAVITSPTGAAVRDFLKVIQRRFANIEVIVVPVKVQGDRATAEIIEALDIVNTSLDADVIVLTRGGGSLEDLWAFNREELAYAIRASRIPVVSAVGHEIDTTISDLAADLRAPTPSAAAELLVMEKETLMERLKEQQGRLLLEMKHQLELVRGRLTSHTRHLRDPRKRLADNYMRLDELTQRIIRGMEFKAQDRRRTLASEVRALLVHSPEHQLAALKQNRDFILRALTLAAGARLRGHRMQVSLMQERLKDLSPYSILNRGYSITRKLPEKSVLKDVKGVREGDRVSVSLAEGELECGVEKIVPA